MMVLCYILANAATAAIPRVTELACMCLDEGYAVQASFQSPILPSGSFMRRSHQPEIGMDLRAALMTLTAIAGPNEQYIWIDGTQKRLAGKLVQKILNISVYGKSKILSDVVSTDSMSIDRNQAPYEIVDCMRQILLKASNGEIAERG